MSARLSVFWREMRDTARAVLADHGVLLVVALAPLIYGFLYPWPYSTQTVQRVPVAVVDLDASRLSRELVRYVQANPRLDARWVTGSEAAARDALARGQVQGLAVLPADLQRDVARGVAVVVPVAGNAAYPLLSKTVLTGFAESVGTVSAGIESRRLQAGGLSAGQANAARAPLTVQEQALFNPEQGYGSYVVPAVAWLVLQQTLMIGAAMLAGRWREQGQLGASLGGWMARVAGLSVWGLGSGLFYLGWVFFLQGYPRGGNLTGALLLALYVPAVCALGFALGGWIGDREGAMYALLATALPIAFVAGVFWPVQALWAPLQALRWLLPSSSGMTAGVRLTQMGASLPDVAPQLGALAAIGLLSLAGLAAGAGRSPAPRHA